MGGGGGAELFPGFGVVSAMAAHGFWNTKKEDGKTEKGQRKELRKVIGKKSEERCAFSEKGLQRIGENIQQVPPPIARQSAVD